MNGICGQNLKGVSRHMHRHTVSRLGLRTRAYLVRGISHRAIRVVIGYTPFEMTSPQLPVMTRDVLATYAQIAHSRRWKNIVIYLDRETRTLALTNMTGCIQRLHDPGYCGITSHKQKPKLRIARILITQA